MEEETREGVELPGLGFDFLDRVYRTSLIVMLFGAMLLWSRSGPSAALGFNLGAGFSLVMIKMWEWAIRRFITPERRSKGAVALVMLLKVPVVALVLWLAYTGAQQGWISLVWVIAGFAVPHVVLVLKLVGRKLNDLVGADEALRPPTRRSK
ncbi:MAG: hypothetical protein ACK47B_07615 [Armatimonadota bacterium]